MGYFKAERTLLRACQSIFAGMELTRLRNTADSGRSKLCHYVCHELQFSWKLLQELNQGCSTDSDKDRAGMLRFVRRCIVFEGQKFSAHRLNPVRTPNPCRQPRTAYSSYVRVPFTSGGCFVDPRPEDATCLEDKDYAQNSRSVFRRTI